MKSYHAFIDESGQRAMTKRSSDHFVLSAVVCGVHNAGASAELLARLRHDLGRQPDQPLHWHHLRPDALRLVAAAEVGNAKFLRVVSVVVCKRELEALPHEDLAYMFTFRLLLERLSWVAREHGGRLSYTLGHVVRFRLAKLREYERHLRDLGGDTTIRWANLDPAGGKINQPKRVEGLQLADIAASATAAAFDEPMREIATDTRYLHALAPALYRDASGRAVRYGLKMHPWNAGVRAKYPWIEAL